MTTETKEKVSLKTVGYVILYVRDAAEASKFYEDKLGIPVRFAEKEWAELETAGFTLALHGCEAVAELPKTAPTVVFSVDDIRGVHASLKEAGLALGDLHQVCEFDGMVGISADFKDPDGNSLSVWGKLPKADWTKA